MSVLCVSHLLSRAKEACSATMTRSNLNRLSISVRVLRLAEKTLLTLSFDSGQNPDRAKFVRPLPKLHLTLFSQG